jgi:hypothetical protein
MEYAITDSITYTTVTKIRTAGSSFLRKFATNCGSNPATVSPSKRKTNALPCRPVYTGQPCKKTGRAGFQRH